MKSYIPLSGMRIWLSGSIPEDATQVDADQLLKFTKGLVSEAFRNGAHVIHGCHPTLVPTLLEAANEYRTNTGRKALLVIMASRARQEPNGGYAGFSKGELESQADFREIPAVVDRNGIPDQDNSLARMRDALAANADALVAIGGKWWKSSPDFAGVPTEFNLAITRGIPSFLLGGLGGATKGFLEQRPDVLRNLRNGLDGKANERLANETKTDCLIESVLDQIARLPIGRRETNTGHPFRILSLDGGGIRGVFTAAVLAKWEELTNQRVVSHFDLIAGTSTGGILALGLALGISAKEMVEFYKKEGPELFPMMGLTQRTWRTLRHFWRNKFDAKILDEKLRAVYSKAPLAAGPFGTKLKSSPQRLLITSYNLTSGKTHLYRTSHHPSVTGHDNLSSEIIARATSAAPSYFEPAKVDDISASHEAVDGGIWANCPALAALCEAVNTLYIPLDRISMLSVGTTDTPLIINSPRLVPGLVGWATRAPNLLMKAQIQTALKHAQELLGHRFLRVDDSAKTKGLDDVSSIALLINKGAELGEQHIKEVTFRFIDGVEAFPWREEEKLLFT